MSKVLFTNAQLRKTLSAVRSLGARGVECEVAETTLLSPAAFSKYSSHSYIYPDPSANLAAYNEWLHRALWKRRYDVLFPMDDNTMQHAIEHREELERLCRLPLPPTESYRIAADKGRTALLAEQAGVPCPKTIMPDTLEHLQESAVVLGYPLVIKPRQSSGSRGIRVIHKAEQLLESYMNIHQQYPYPILQEYIPQGERYDVCLLYNMEGMARYTFVQKELRHFPIDMGPSTVQESVRYPELVEMAKTMMSNLPWFGIAELEFMIDPRDGTPKLMEINPRFWNSLHTASMSGVDFPWGLYQLTMGSDVEEIVDYKLGVRCRWLLPGDLLHFIANPQRMSMEPPFFGKGAARQDDIWSISDPMPTLGFALACLRYSLDPKAWRFLLNR
jgi:predicted ATP-grasp superfamily ATP-dependent carboligase